jgi:hypothetical protein
MYTVTANSLLKKRSWQAIAFWLGKGFHQKDATKTGFPEVQARRKLFAPKE